MEYNSIEYWNKRFEEDWEARKGREQTRFFTELALSLLPEPFKKLLTGEKLSVLDWGCAEGDGTPILAYVFTGRVTGLDFADKAIEKAKTYYPEREFFTGSLLDYNRRFDVIFTSNCLEHFDHPFHWLKHLMEYTDHFVIVLVPFQQSKEELGTEHRISFDYSSFPVRFEDFIAVYHKEVSVAEEWKWYGKQFLVVYANLQSPYLGSLEQWR